jgi:phosphomannomutase
MMITASHNPSCDNGLKIGYVDDSVIDREMYKSMEDCLNSEEEFKKYITLHLNRLHNQLKQMRKPVCFLGRDARPSSPQLSKIVEQAFEMF